MYLLVVNSVVVVVVRGDGGGVGVVTGSLQKELISLIERSGSYVNLKLLGSRKENSGVLISTRVVSARPNLPLRSG